MSRQRPTFTPEFKREAACLVLDQGYSHTEAARSLELVESALRRWVTQLQQERGGVTPISKALTPEQQKNRNWKLESTAGTGKIDLKKGCRALDGRGARPLALVDQLRSEEPVDLLCSVFEVTYSCYYAYAVDSVNHGIKLLEWAVNWPKPIASLHRLAHARRCRRGVGGQLAARPSLAERSNFGHGRAG